ncbi:MAG: BatD family protein [Magnetococcus sp. MYC-9]
MVNHAATRLSCLMVVLLFLLGISPVLAQGSTLQVRTDRQPIHEGESFRLIFETGKEPDGSPDFSVLGEEFDLLGKRQGSSFQIVNGQRSHKTTWTVTLRARKAGTFTIPAIAFGREKSPEYVVTIHPEPSPRAQPSDKQEDDLFLEVTTAPEKIHVQSQVIYTVRFFRSVEISGASLTEPQLDASDAVIEKLGEDHTFETNRNGNHYLVVERRYALFPQRSGKMTIAPLRLEVQVGKRGLFSLFDDPLSGGGGSVKRRQSAPVELEVEPIPVAARGGAWLPAHRLQLLEKWSETPPRFQVGEAITRTLTLLADGLTSAQLPEIGMQDAMPGKHASLFKMYPDQPVLTDQRERTGIIGMRQEKLALVPSQAGTFVLPAVEVAWWNVDSQTREVARLPERTITVKESPGAARSQAVPAEPAWHTPGDSSSAHQQNPTEGASDQKQVCVAETESAGQRPESFVARETLLSGLALLLAFGWAGTVWLGVRGGAFRWPGRRSPHRVPVNVELERQRGLLKEACSRNDAVQSRAALLGWAQARWPAEGLRTLNDLQQFLQQTHKEILLQELQRLNQALFSTSASVWSGQPLWDAIVAIPPQSAPHSTEWLPSF